MYCKNCGKEIDDDSKFCQYCGTSLDNNHPIDSNKVISKSFIHLKSCRYSLIYAIYAICVLLLSIEDCEGSWDRPFDTTSFIQEIIGWGILFPLIIYSINRLIKNIKYRIKNKRAASKAKKEAEAQSQNENKPYECFATRTRKMIEEAQEYNKTHNS